MYYINNRKNRLNTWEKRIYKLCFNTFEIEEFKLILALSKTQSFSPCKDETRILIQEKEMPSSIYLLTDGHLAVTSSKGLNVDIKEGTFIGELSFIQGKIPYASVSAKDRCEYIEWNQDKLQEFLKTHISIKQKFYALFLEDIIKKLRESSS